MLGGMGAGGGSTGGHKPDIFCLHAATPHPSGERPIPPSQHCAQQGGSTCQQGVGVAKRPVATDGQPHTLHGSPEGCQLTGDGLSEPAVCVRHEHAFMRVLIHSMRRLLWCLRGAGRGVREG